MTLPIDAYLPNIIKAFQRSSNLILKASPGSGKTTRLPPALLPLLKNSLKKIIVLVPKRIAAVSAADRIATENNWLLGSKVGYHVRFEPVFNSSTQLIFMTEGVFLKKAQDENFWKSIDILVFDEFHERSAQTDISLGLALEKQILNEELKIIIMSATLNTQTLESYLPQNEVMAGKEIRVQDRKGNGFLFRAAQGQPASAPISLAAAMGDLLGSVSSGRRKKTLAGYGRD